MWSKRGNLQLSETTTSSYWQALQSWWGYTSLSKTTCPGPSAQAAYPSRPVYNQGLSLHLPHSHSRHRSLLDFQQHAYNVVRG